MNVDIPDISYSGSIVTVWRAVLYETLAQNVFYLHNQMEDKQFLAITFTNYRYCENKSENSHWIITQ